MRAVDTTTRRGDALPAAADTTPILERVETFARRHMARLDDWNARLGSGLEGDVALWGAGAKGVAFLNLLDDSMAIDHVVDVNPRKAGRHVPGTGHRIDTPDSLRGHDVRSVLIMNPAYEREISNELDRLGVDAIVEEV